MDLALKHGLLFLVQSLHSLQLTLRLTRASLELRDLLRVVLLERVVVVLDVGDLANERQLLHLDPGDVAPEALYHLVTLLFQPLQTHVLRLHSFQVAQLVLHFPQLQ